jgi:adenylate kinase
MHRPLHLAVIGRQGSGKGTQARLLAERLRIAHLSTGDLLRAEARGAGPSADAIRGYMEAGALVPDGLLDGVVARAIQAHPSGFILDGYPRTRQQVDILDRLTDLDVAIELDLPARDAVARLAARRVCASCGVSATESAEACPICGAALTRRDDDAPDAVARRLALYQQSTAPIIRIYAARDLLERVDASGPVATVAARVLRAVERGLTRRLGRLAAIS